MAVKELHINFDENAKDANLKGRRELLSKSVEGNWATIFKGKGMEFTGYRAYAFSDDASAIDWKASLRSKQILVREFEEFKNFNIIFMLDVSNSMLFSSGKKFKAEYAAELVYELSQSAFTGGDAVGLAMFSDQIVAKVPPGFGFGMKKHFAITLNKKQFYGGEKDVKKSLLELNSVLGDRAIIVILSDFLGFSPEWEKYLAILAHKHQVIGLMIRDERDRELPRSGGQYFVKDPNTNETLFVDSHDFAKQYHQLAVDHEEYIKGVFKKLRSDCILVLNESDSFKKLEKFFAGLVV